MASEKLPEFSRYEIVGILGNGSMGAVYKATHKLLDRSVALKVPRREMLQNPTSAERFLREGKALAMLQHPNIVAIFDADIEGDLPYIAMEYIEGGTLRHRIARTKRIPIDRICDWLAELAMALDYIHQKGILHRDLKSSNILITKDNRALLTDFGIASIDLMATITSGLLGTPAYMSPEQARGEELDGRSDIYSLGVVLYEALTGTVPFYRENGLAILQQIIHEQPKPVQEIRPETPDWVAQIAMTCLEKAPANRFQSGKEVVAALASGKSNRAFATATMDNSTDGALPMLLGYWEKTLLPRIQALRRNKRIAMLTVFILVACVAFFSLRSMNRITVDSNTLNPDPTLIETDSSSVDADSTGPQWSPW